MGVNRIVLDTTEGEQVLIDISDSTIKPETVAEGEKGYGADGEPFIGTMTQSGGLDTSDATAYPYHVVAPYTFYAKGEKQTGTVEHVTSPSLTLNKLSDYSTKTIRVLARSDKSMYTTSSTYFSVYVPKSNFGDATASDVVKGKTFTSSAGLKVEGTYEPPVSAGGVNF